MLLEKATILLSLYNLNNMLLKLGGSLSDSDAESESSVFSDSSKGKGRESSGSSLSISVILRVDYYKSTFINRLYLDNFTFQMNL